MRDLAASTAMADDLAMQRDRYITQLAAAIREATQALAALDLVSFDRSTALQLELCKELSVVTGQLATHPSGPASVASTRELSGALRTYRSLLRRSAQWVETSRKTLQLITGFPEPSSLGQGLRY